MSIPHARFSFVPLIFFMLIYILHAYFFSKSVQITGITLLLLPLHADSVLMVRCCSCSHVMEADVGSHNSFLGIFYPNDSLYANDDLTDRENETFKWLASEECRFAFADHCLVCYRVMLIVWNAKGPPLATQGGDGESTSDGQLIMLYMHGVEPCEDDYDLSKISQWKVERTVDGKLFDDIVIVDGCASSLNGDNSSINAALDDDPDNDNGGGGCGGDHSQEITSARAYFIKLNDDDVIWDILEVLEGYC
ncbi:uncharacterized protein LOC116106159 [Pistacia vera]|uniref:uncharacterized protein LOC116106159 n=1 Tax=Pistacia vera TaxID=55513 RepID=UPI001262BECC|nr:uncharacterized protein LOC116106159 [Pistacia vera]